MLQAILIPFYERDIRQLMEELSLFEREEDLWKVRGSIKNASGHLALHITGGLNYLVGTLLGHTGYVRNRDLEFSSPPVPREQLIAGLEALIPMIQRSLSTLDMASDYPIPFDDAVRTNGYVLLQLALHLNYHLGQVNYLRRMLT
ncbi:DinB family protein [Taibaiella koreensis]|uniref:DinB superfamily protein n=1 Tax=Taibaiella koreensis TaxID=1268548 RepID=UPI000E59A29F|nr:DinB superfamily protein [Taibaiella koreensis]